MQISLTRYEIEILLNLTVKHGYTDICRTIEEQTGITWEEIQKESITE